MTNPRQEAIHDLSEEIDTTIGVGHDGFAVLEALALLIEDRYCDPYSECPRANAVLERLADAIRSAATELEAIAETEGPVF